MNGKKKTMFLYYDPHYFHAALAKSIGSEPYPAPQIRSTRDDLMATASDVAKSINAVVSIPKNYDVYFCEGTYLFPAIAKSMGLLGRNAKIINIVSSPLLYYMKIGRIGGSKRALGIRMLKKVDGFVCVGKMEERLLKGFYPGANTMVTYPFIRKEVREKITKRGKPDLESKRILCIGSRDVYCKGIDLLVEAFEKAKRRIPGLKLTVLGDYDKNSISSDDPAIKFPGYMADTSKFIKDAALYVHLGRGEAFGISIMEAMFAGLPVIVSDATGAKELVLKVDRKMVVPLNASKAADAIVRYFSLNAKERKDLAVKSKRAVHPYTEESITSSFKRGYKSLLERTES